MRTPLRWWQMWCGWRCKYTKNMLSQAAPIGLFWISALLASNVLPKSCRKVATTLMPFSPNSLTHSSQKPTPFAQEHKRRWFVWSIWECGTRAIFNTSPNCCPNAWVRLTQPLTSWNLDFPAMIRQKVPRKWYPRGLRCLCLIVKDGCEKTLAAYVLSGGEKTCKPWFCQLFPCFNQISLESSPNTLNSSMFCFLKHFHMLGLVFSVRTVEMRPRDNPSPCLQKLGLDLA